MIKLAIEGRWEPSDFSEVLEALESLYYKIAPADLPESMRYSFFVPGPRPYEFTRYYDYLDIANRWIIDRSRIFAPIDRRLRVKRIEFSSPGGIDLVGLGEATKAIDSLVGRLITFFTERRLRREKDKQAAIETEMMEQNLASLKIDNAKKLLELHRDFPEVDPHILIPLMVRDQDKLADRIAQGMITDQRR